MQQFVKWDREAQRIVKGPQSEPGSGDDWFVLIDNENISNAKTQTKVFTFYEEAQLVIATVEGDPDLTWEQARQGGYGSITEQLDLLWHDIDNNTLDQSGQFYAFIKGVKDQNPKP